MKAPFLSLVCFLFIVNGLRAQEMPGDLTKKQISDALEHARRDAAQVFRESETWKSLHPEPKPWWSDGLWYGLRALLLVTAAGVIRWVWSEIRRPPTEEEPKHKRLSLHVRVGPDAKWRCAGCGAASPLWYPAVVSVEGQTRDVVLCKDCANDKTVLDRLGARIRPDGIVQEPKPKANDNPDAAGGSMGRV
jgi:hypothetical protein